MMSYVYFVFEKMNEHIFESTISGLFWKNSDVVKIAMILALIPKKIHVCLRNIKKLVGFLFPVLILTSDRNFYDAY